MKERFDSYILDVLRCCGNRFQMLSGDDHLNQFCKYMIDMSGKSRSIWIAHNGACFVTILCWFLTSSCIVPNVVIRLCA